jgi:hypothetical protein
LIFAVNAAIVITIETGLPHESALIHGYFGDCGIFLLKSAATGAKAGTRTFTPS